jgi:sirohydrochlorin cobaltochelatase
MEPGSSVRRGLILFAHGAREPGWRTPFERLHQMIQAQLPQVEVRLAFLELMTPDLATMVRQLVQDGCGAITVVPVFLGQGGHVRRDLPALLAQLRIDHPQLLLRAAEAVGEDASVLQAIAAYCIASLGKQ